MTRKVERRDGYVVITMDGAPEPVPMTCPNCELVMSTRDDLVSYAKWKCCSWCERMWVQGEKRDRWRNGWRPSRDVVESTLRNLGMI